MSKRADSNGHAPLTFAQIYQKAVLELDHGPFHLWHCLRMHADSATSRCFPGWATIIEEIRCDRGSIKAWTETLVAGGWLAYTDKMCRRGKRIARRIYTVLDGTGMPLYSRGLDRSKPAKAKPKSRKRGAGKSRPKSGWVNRPKTFGMGSRAVRSENHSETSVGNPTLTEESEVSYSPFPAYADSPQGNSAPHSAGSQPLSHSLPLSAADAVRATAATHQRELSPSVHSPQPTAPSSEKEKSAAEARSARRKKCIEELDPEDMATVEACYHEFQGETGLPKFDTQHAAWEALRIGHLPRDEDRTAAVANYKAVMLAWLGQQNQPAPSAGK